MNSGETVASDERISKDRQALLLYLFVCSWSAESKEGMSLAWRISVCTFDDDDDQSLTDFRSPSANSKLVQSRISLMLII